MATIEAGQWSKLRQRAFLYTSPEHPLCTPTDGSASTKPPCTPDRVQPNVKTTPISIQTASAIPSNRHNRRSTSTIIKTAVGVETTPNIPPESFIRMLWRAHDPSILMAAASRIHTTVRHSLEGIHTAKKESDMYPHVQDIMDKVTSFDPLSVRPLNSVTGPNIADLQGNTPNQKPLRYLTSSSIIPGGEQHGFRPDGVLVEDMVADKFNDLYYGRGTDQISQEVEGDRVEDLAMGENATPTESDTQRRGLIVTKDESGLAASEASNTMAVPSQPLAKTEKARQAKAGAFLKWSRIVVAIEIKHKHIPSHAEPQSTNATSTSTSSSLGLPQSSHTSGTPTTSQSQAGNKRKSSVDEVPSSASKRRKGVNGRSEPIHSDVKPGAVQLAGYMGEVRSALGIRCHTFGCLITNSKFEVWCADACGIFKSSTLDLQDAAQFAVFAVIVAGLVRASTDVLGLDPRFVRPPSTSSPDYVWPTSLEGWKFKTTCRLLSIIEMLYIQRGLHGRNTVVMKVLWPEEGWGKTKGTEETGEVEGNEKAGEVESGGEVKGGEVDEEHAAVKYAVVKYAYTFASREREYELAMEARRLLQNSDHIVHVYGGESGELLSKSLIRDVLMEENGFEGDVLDRRPDITFMEFLLPIYSFPFDSEVVRCYKHVAEVLRDLNDHHIQHRDVSIGNILVRHTTRSLCGVLSDLDHAVKRGPNDLKGSGTNHRTGTFPFLAIHLLEALPGKCPDHILRFDLESILYVLIWHLARFGTGALIAPKDGGRPFDEWLDPVRESNLNSKSNLAHLILKLEEKWGLKDVPAVALCAEPLQVFAIRMMIARLSISKDKNVVDASEWTDLKGVFAAKSVEQLFADLLEVLTPLG